MAISYTSVMRAINNLTKPMQEKVLKKLGLSTKGLPGRTSKKDGITVGKDRVKIEKKINRLAGGAVGVGGTVAAYTASDFINDLLGIKKTGDATLTKADKRRLGEAQADTRNKTKTTVKKKKPNVPTEKPTPRPKKKMFMKERSGKDSKVEFGTGKAKTKLSTGGATGLKKISDDQPGLKALKKKAPQVVRNMGYLRKGSLVTKKKTKGGSKGGKGILVVSIGVGKMTKKKPTTKKKKTTKKTKSA